MPSYDEAALMKLKPPEWLVEDLIPEGELGVLAGPPGAYKSTLTLQLALAVANGQRFLKGDDCAREISYGYQASPGPVILVDAESPPHQFAERYRALRNEDERGERIRFILKDRDPALTRAEWLAEICDEVRKRGAKLVILDPLAELARGLDLNKGDEMNRAIGAAREIQASGAAVLLVHHISKVDAGEFYKNLSGSGRLSAAVDFGWEMRPINKQDCTVKLIIAKSRWTRPEPPIRLAAMGNGRLEMDLGWSPDPSLEEGCEKVAAAWAGWPSNQGFTVDKMHGELGAALSVRDVRACLNYLRDLHVLTWKRGSHNRYHYQLDPRLQEDLQFAGSGKVSLDPSRVLSDQQEWFLGLIKAQTAPDGPRE